MWFDVVLIDKLFANGALQSTHIRAGDSGSFATDRLEDINPDFRATNTADIGPLRVYEQGRVRHTTLESQLKNFEHSPSQILVQLDHFGIPVVSGYYAIIFPRGWRVAEINVYDPYHKAEDLAEKRTYRGVDLLWDNAAQMSAAQFNMESVGRGTFSVGVIACLRPSNSTTEWKDRSGQLSVNFSNSRHSGQPDESAYRNVTDAVVENVKSRNEVPSINISSSGLSTDLVAWGRFLWGKYRTPR
jgi:hypothetical protein